MHIKQKHQKCFVFRGISHWQGGREREREEELLKKKKFFTDRELLNQATNMMVPYGAIEQHVIRLDSFLPNNGLQWETRCEVRRDH